MDRLLRGEFPPGGNCDIKTLARESCIDRTAFYGTRPYARLREEFETASSAIRQAGNTARPAATPRPPAWKTRSPRSGSAWPASATRSPSSPSFRPPALPASPPSTTRSTCCAKPPRTPPASACYPPQPPDPAKRLAASVPGHRPAQACPPDPDEPEPAMPRLPITATLLADLLTAARAHGARIIDVAVVVETPHTILLLHQGDGDDFSPYRWDLPAATRAASPRPARRRHPAGRHRHRRRRRGRDHRLPWPPRRHCWRHQPAHPRVHRNRHRPGPHAPRRPPRTPVAVTRRNPLRFPDATTPLARHLASTALRLPSAHPQPEPAIAAALRAGAAALYPLEAAC